MNQYTIEAIVNNTVTATKIAAPVAALYASSYVLGNEVPSYFAGLWTLGYISYVDDIITKNGSKNWKG